MTVRVKLNTPIGSGYGPNFTLAANVGAIFPFTATLTQLTTGLGLSVTVDPAATTITVISTTGCETPIVLTIVRTTTTTSTTTTTTTTTLVPLERFQMVATGITKFSFSNFITSVPISINFGPATVNYPAGTYTGGTMITYTYSTAYTGSITISTVDLTGITTLEIAANITTPSVIDYILPQRTGNISSPSGFTVYIAGNQLVKLNGLTKLNINNTVLISATTTGQLPRTLSSISILYADVSGFISALPDATPTTKDSFINVQNFNTVTGDLATMPSSYNSINFGGDNTISGQIFSLQSHVQSFAILGKNTLAGNVNTIPNSYASGTVANSVLTSFNVQGYNTLSGNIRQFNIERIRLLSIVGEPNPSTGLGGNTISGTIDANGADTRLWNTLTATGSPIVVGGITIIPGPFTTFQVLGKTTISGTLSTFTNCTLLNRIAIDGKTTGAIPTAGNTITGNLSSLPLASGTNTALDRLILAGANTVVGALTTITNFTVLRTITLSGSSNITGTLSDLPISVYSLNIEGNSNIKTYPTQREKASPISRFSNIPKTPAGNSLSGAQLSQLLIDLDQLVLTTGSRTWERSEGGIIAAVITLYGDLANITTPGDTARLSLIAKFAALPGTGNTVTITQST
jgi:hypothetical protein